MGARKASTLPTRKDCIPFAITEFHHASTLVFPPIPDFGKWATCRGDQTSDSGNRRGCQEIRIGAGDEIAAIPDQAPDRFDRWRGSRESGSRFLYPHLRLRVVSLSNRLDKANRLEESCFLSEAVVRKATANCYSGF